jgi:DNA-binding transcriptional ArsR family regulator
VKLIKKHMSKYLKGCDVKETAELFKVLSVDRRIEIIELLKKEAMSVNALAEALGVTQSAVSQHLRVLKAAGLVRDERQGYWIYYSLNREALEKARQRLNRVCTCGCGGGEKKC